MTATPLLDMIDNMDDPRRLPEGELQRLAAELRDATIGAVSKTGGHLGAGLGVVELTVALHYVFQTPHDGLIWDVGHQAYPHKIPTGQREQIETLSQLPALAVRVDHPVGNRHATHHKPAVNMPGIGKILHDMGREAAKIAAALRAMPGLDEAGTSSSSQSKTSS